MYYIMTFNKIVIYDNNIFKPRELIYKCEGLIVSTTWNMITYINANSCILNTPLKYNNYVKIIENAYLDKKEKMKWINIIKQYMRNNRYNNTNNNHTNLLYLLNKLVSFKRKKYIISKIFNIYKIDECPICFEKRKMVKLHSSNHCVCIKCYLKIDKCPICRANLY